MGQLAADRAVEVRKPPALAVLHSQAGQSNRKVCRRTEGRPQSGFPALVGVVVLVVAFVLTLPALTRSRARCAITSASVVSYNSSVARCRAHVGMDAVDEPSSGCDMSSFAASTVGISTLHSAGPACAVRGWAAFRGLPFEHGNDRAAVRLLSGEHTDLTYDDPDQVDEGETVEQVIEVLREESGVLRCHGDRLVVLYSRGVASIEVAPRGASL